MQPSFMRSFPNRSPLSLVVWSLVVLRGTWAVDHAVADVTAASILGWRVTSSERETVVIEQYSELVLLIMALV